jgi:NADH:ubiquinone oxidoreductase subunit 2 (subunit N)
MRLIQSIDYAAIAPPMVVASTGVVVLVADLFVGRAARRTVAFALSMLGTLVALGTTAWLATGSTRSTFCLPDGCSYVADDFALFFQLLFLAVLVVVLLISLAGIADDRMPPGEYHALLL